MPIDLAKRSLEVGNKYPYDAPDNWDGERELPPVDWAHKAARGILYDLGDRGGVKRAFADIDEGVRADIVKALAAIIRSANPDPGTCEWKEDPDEYMAGCWDTACGEKWCFTADGPTENGMKFCHNCGKPVNLANPIHGESHE